MCDAREHVNTGTTRFSNVAENEETSRKGFTLHQHSNLAHNGDDTYSTMSTMIQRSQIDITPSSKPTVTHIGHSIRGYMIHTECFDTDADDIMISSMICEFVDGRQCRRRPGMQPPCTDFQVICAFVLQSFFYRLRPSKRPSVCEAASTAAIVRPPVVVLATTNDLLDCCGQRTEVRCGAVDFHSNLNDREIDSAIA